jgi:hypothetical protein
MQSGADAEWAAAVCASTLLQNAFWYCRCVSPAAALLLPVFLWPCNTGPQKLLITTLLHLGTEFAKAFAEVPLQLTLILFRISA